MEAITLRTEEEADAEFLFRLYASTREAELMMTPWDEAQKEGFLRMQFAAQTHHYRTHYADSSFQIILADGSAIGRLYLHRGKQEYRIVDIALLPEWQKRGIGGGLLTALIAEADAVGLPVTLYVEGDNPAAHLYERLGFERGEPHGIYFFMRRPTPVRVSPT